MENELIEKVECGKVSILLLLYLYNLISDILLPWHSRGTQVTTVNLASLDKLGGHIYIGKHYPVVRRHILTLQAKVATRSKQPH